FSETRRPHPLGTKTAVTDAIQAEQKVLEPIRRLADHVIDTSKFNVHELREVIQAKMQDRSEESKILVQVVSFGFRHGVPTTADLVFDVRFLPNPNYIPEFKPLTGKHPNVARYIRSFPQTQEFIARLSDMLIYLLPHYIREGKSYLTIAVGCTGGQHRSVMMTAELRKMLQKAGYTVKESHRDMPR
ncbi:MAG TPA: RNase adapter RapZ, partial [Bryobacteraceae bacterium]|nr:RNase adapter RapZ [Bryobacteraceae bacterium]